MAVRNSRESSMVPISRLHNDISTWLPYSVFSLSCTIWSNVPPAVAAPQEHYSPWQSCVSTQSRSSGFGETEPWQEQQCVICLTTQWRNLQPTTPSVQAAFLNCHAWRPGRQHNWLLGSRLARCLSERRRAVPAPFLAYFGIMRSVVQIHSPRP